MTPATFLRAEEILTLKKLEKKAKEFSISRDIFSPDTMAPPVQAMQSVPVPQVVETPPEEEPKVEEKEDIEAEIRRSLFFEGYVIKHPKNFALVSANGEFFAVGNGDLLMDKIKIIKIDKKTITVEVDSKTFDLQLKGDNSNEQNFTQQNQREQNEREENEQ